MITSVENQKVKRVVQLNKKPSQRKKESVFVVEGMKMFLEAPEGDLEEIYVSEGFLKEIGEPGKAGRLERGGRSSVLKEGTEEVSEKRLILREETFHKLERCGYEVVSGQVFMKMSDTQSPQGILCVVRQLQYDLDEMAERAGTPLFLILENLQDPGNLGTIMRTGEGAGVNGVIMSMDTVDIYNPKTIRATMGSIYRVPFVYTPDIGRAMERLQEKGIGIYAAHLEGKKYYDECDYRKPIAFLIGNEGNGLTEETAGRADSYIRIPMEGKLESLNAAVAAAILIYEAAGQRRRG